MYLLSLADGYRFASPDEVYVLELVPLQSASAPARLAAISTDQTLTVLDALNIRRGPLTTLATKHGNVTALKPMDWRQCGGGGGAGVVVDGTGTDGGSSEGAAAAADLLATAGENGSVSVWDLRISGGQAEVLRLEGKLFLVKSWTLFWAWAGFCPALLLDSCWGRRKRGRGVKSSSNGGGGRGSAGSLRRQVAKTPMCLVLPFPTEQVGRDEAGESLSTVDGVHARLRRFFRPLVSNPPSPIPPSLLPYGVVMTIAMSQALLWWRWPDFSLFLAFAASQVPVLSLACSASTHSLAVGTELADLQASILVW